MTVLKLSIKENAIDSFNEALAKFESGQNGTLKDYKFAVLHMAHFVELILKQYVISINPLLAYKICFAALIKLNEKSNGQDLLSTYKDMVKNSFDFQAIIDSYILSQNNKSKEPILFTILVKNALSLAQCEVCSKTGNKFLDQDFIDDIEWMKALRNEIEHFEFSLNPKDVRLAIGRLIRSSAEFLDIFSLFNLDQHISENNRQIYHQLSDEYEQHLKEAKIIVAEETQRAFQVSPKDRMLVSWEVLDCSNCHEESIVIPNNESTTGYRCQACGHDEDDNIPVECDDCGGKYPQELINNMADDEGNITYQICEDCWSNKMAD